MTVEPDIQLVLSPYQNVFFHELADVIVHELRQGGCQASLVSPATAVFDERSVFVLLPPHEFAALEGGAWMHHHALPQRTIALLAEQPTQAHFHQNAAIARRVAAAFDFNPWAVKAYQRHGVDARHLPFGYTSLWDRFPGNSERSLDVLYMGSAEKRRQQLLAQCGPALGRLRSRIIISDNSSPNRSSSASFVAGDAKRQLLADSRLLLNIHRGDEPYFEWLRFIEAFHCGVPVLSEPSLHTEPYVAGRHFLSAHPDSLPGVIEAVLADPQRLDAVRHDAYDELRRHPFARSLDQLVDVARGLTENPVPSSLPPLTRTRPLAHPLDEVRTLDVDSDMSVLRQSMREVRLDMQGLRRQLATVEALLSDPNAARAPATAVACTSIAQAMATDAPTVSVVMALYNHADYVREALDSTVPGADGMSFEIVVVDDGSTDSSFDVVKEWVQAHPWVRSRLIRHRANRGLPHARNTAIAAATGEFAFVLDADNEILPGAFTRLVEALRTNPEARFAYGMLEAFNNADSIDTMGVWPWQPKRLRNGNYIDAMAMIRMQVLRDMGGYTTDRRLYGWEDYELWCRIAESGAYGVQLPNFVARYRRSITSMVALSNVSDIAAFAALRESCPKLMGGQLDDVEIGAVG